MIALLTLTVLAIGLSGSVADYCDYVRNRDCYHVPDFKKVCGTDGKTYWNNCALVTSYCLDKSIHKAHDGACSSTPASTTVPPVNGAQLALDIFCMDVAYIDCPKTGANNVCGSDSRYYLNMCEFDKARCQHRDLHQDATGASCP